MKQGPLKATQSFGLKTTPITSVSPIQHNPRRARKLPNNRISPDILTSTTKGEKCYLSTSFRRPTSSVVSQSGGSSFMKRTNSLDRMSLANSYLNCQWPTLTSDRATQTEACDYISNVEVQHQTRSSSQGEKIMSSRIKSKGLSGSQKGMTPTHLKVTKSTRKPKNVTTFTKRRQEGSVEALNQEMEKLNIVLKTTPITSISSNSHRLPDGRRAPISEFLRELAPSKCSRHKNNSSVTQILHHKQETELCDDSYDSQTSSNCSTNDKDSILFVRSPPDGCDIIKITDESSQAKNNFLFCPIQNNEQILNLKCVPRIPSLKSAFLPR